MKPQIPWLRVFVEGVVIVGSILLAFGIDAWWDARQQRVEELEALRLIHADLVADTIEIQQASNTPARFVTAARWLLRRWDTASPPPDSVGAAVQDLIPLGSIQFRRAGFDGVRDGDRLSLIESDTLRAAIVGYFDDSQVFGLQRQDRVYAERERLLEALFPYVQLRQPAVQAVPWEQIQRDNYLLNRLAMLVATSERMLVALDRMSSSNTRVRAMIEDEIKARW